MNLFADTMTNVPAPSDIELEATDYSRRSAVHTTAKIPIRNCVTNHKKKWYNVLFFETEPRERPRISKEGQLVAKFTGEGDAWVYAQSKQFIPEPLWAIVIR